MGDEPRVQGNGLRVLVVDDVHDAADTLAALVRLYGHTARVTYDGSAALEVARSEPPDVALLDLAMPGRDGFELARQLTSLAGGRKPLLVALTGCGDEEHRRLADEAGFHLHLLKPVDPEQLQALLMRFEGLLAAAEPAA